VKLQITVDGRRYEVEVEAFEPDPRLHAHVSPFATARVPAQPAALARGEALAGTGGSVAGHPGAGHGPPGGGGAGQGTESGGGDPAAAGDGEVESRVCRSPIAGTVIRVVAQEGQALQPGDALLVLEAMKMETSITAPRAGRLVKLRVTVGQAVRTGQVLVDLD
jgi:methylmalonyl-CoA carboxyltransferase small subunit